MKYKVEMRFPSGPKWGYDCLVVTTDIEASSHEMAADLAKLKDPEGVLLSTELVA